MYALEVSIDGKLVGVYVPPSDSPFAAMVGNIPRTYMRAHIMTGNDKESWQWQLPDIQPGQCISFRLIEAPVGSGVPPQFVRPRVSVPSWNSAESAGLKTGETQGSGGVFFKQRRQPFFLLPSAQRALSAVLAGSTQASGRGESGGSRKQPACLKTAGFQTGRLGRFSRRH